MNRIILIFVAMVALSSCASGRSDSHHSEVYGEIKSGIEVMHVH